MRMSSFNKQEKTATCLYCKKNKVSINRWQARCSECKKKLKTIESEVSTIKKQPAAILKDDSGNEIYVDKFGNVVDNPGYDTKNDPRGWQYSGKAKGERTVIS